MSYDKIHFNLLKSPIHLMERLGCINLNNGDTVECACYIRRITLTLFKDELYTE